MSLKNPTKTQPLSLCPKEFHLLRLRCSAIRRRSPLPSGRGRPLCAARGTRWGCAAQSGAAPSRAARADKQAEHVLCQHHPETRASRASPRGKGALRCSEVNPSPFSSLVASPWVRLASPVSRLPLADWSTGLLGRASSTGLVLGKSAATWFSKRPRDTGGLCLLMFLLSTSWNHIYVFVIPG